ncbi:hypothetical protein [Nocardia sp. GTS18]|uniref:hypothetical protein n=1 Tax=Nocardia sp. GTS18 TaxID=1778064 RepID=UPI0015EEABF6|nr:hypothetical protein [Nocardia sp. GTS18]
MATSQVSARQLVDQVRKPPLDRRAGLVTAVTAMLAGEQQIFVDVVGAHSGDARIVVRWGRVVMTFTSAEQVQRMVGLFGLARQAMVGVDQRVPMPVVEAPISEVAVLAAITWTHTPSGAASVERMYHEGMRRSISYVALSISPVTFHILDRDGLNSASKALVRAHQLAVTVYPDGARYAGDPNAAAWQRANRRHLKPRGGGWSHR